MDIAPIIAAIIAIPAAVTSAIAAVYSAIATKKGNEKNIESTEKISKQVQNAENERTKAQIDANLVWNARIEWIQNVRRVTVDFITACYIYMQTDEDDIKQQYKNKVLVQKNKALLILYFGPDNPKGDEKLASDICDPTTNAGKNKMIVDLINQIYKQADNYFKNKKELLSANLDLNQCFRCENEDKHLCEKNGYGDFYTKTDCTNLQKELRHNTSKIISEMQKFHNNIDLLSEAMRIYLKREWYEAKNWDKK